MLANKSCRAQSSAELSKWEHLQCSRPGAQPQRSSSLGKRHSSQLARTPNYRGMGRLRHGIGCQVSDDGQPPRDLFPRLLAMMIYQLFLLMDE
jgi:hypothetical protein